MKTYHIGLTRTYLVEIRAENIEKAKQIAEFYLGDCHDLSTENDQRENDFVIENIEMTYNEADEVNLT